MSINKIKIGCLNIRSLIPSFMECKQIILENNYEIFSICETWLRADTPNYLIHIDGYKVYRYDRNARGGGLCIYVKNSIITSLIDIKNNLTEQLWINVKCKKDNFAVGVVYRPPTLDSNLFLAELEDTLGLIFPAVEDIICMGDFNIDMLKLDNLDYFFSVLESFNLKQIIETPTRITQTTATLIDLILVGREEKVVEKGVVDCQISDHQLIYCMIKVTGKRNGPEMRTYRNFKNFNYGAFETDLFNTPFYNIFDLNDINDKVSYLSTNLMNLFDQHAPIITSRVTKPRAPWLTDTIKLMISIRDKAQRKYKKTKNEAHFQYYKELRNYTTEAIKREKKAYLNFQLSNSSSKECWKILKTNNIIPNSKINEIPTELKKPNDINNHFVNSIPATHPSDDLIHFYETNRVCNTNLKFQSVNELTLYQIINKISTKAAGCDGINIELIKLSCPHILPYITHIINICLTESVYPSMWKNAMVTVLPKKANPENFQDLRAISILPTFSKLIEKIMEQQLIVHLSDNNIIPHVQSGFRVGHSCTTALLNVTDDILGAIDQGLCTVLVLLDFSRAFDTINYRMFEAILHYIGLSEEAVTLIKDYMSNRQQKVSIDHESSDSLTLKAGVPQGSILGPLFFNIYSSQLIKSLSYCEAHFYADDAQLYHSFPPNETDNACAHINEDLKHFVDLSKDHCLVINPNKSKVIIFGHKKYRNEVKRNIQISVENEIIESVNETKNLGVIIDEDLRFNTHVNKLTQKAYNALKLIYGNRHYLPQKTKIILCESLILSSLNFADSVYGPSLTSLYKRKIQKIQNSCLRLIFGIRMRERISYKLRDVGWLNMDNRRLHHAACLYHKIIANKSPQYLYRKIKFRTDVHNLNVRFKGLLTPPPHRTELFKRSFRYRICKVYNSVPQELKNSKLKSFKTKYKSLLFTAQCQQ